MHAEHSAVSTSMRSSPFHRPAGLVARAAGVCVSALAALAVTGAAAWASPAPAAPAAPGLFPVHPGPHGYFDYTLPPAGATSGTVVVDNPTGSPARYLLYAAGASTSPVGGVAYGQPEAHHAGPASWLTLSASFVTLGPKGRSPLRFSVAVPPSAAPGDYVAAIAAQAPPAASTTAPAAAGRAVRLVTTTRVIVAVVVHVPGPAHPAARFGRPSVGLQAQRRQVLSVPIDDTGNALMKPYLAGDLRRCSGGAPVLHMARQLDTFVPKTSIDYPWYLNDQVLAAGCYRISLALDLGAGGPRLAGYTGRLRVGTAATEVRRPSARAVLPSHTRLPAWVLAAGSAAALAILAAIALLLRARSERRRLLRRLANADTPVGSTRS